MLVDGSSEEEEETGRGIEGGGLVERSRECSDNTESAWALQCADGVVGEDPITGACVVGVTELPDLSRTTASSLSSSVGGVISPDC